LSDATGGMRELVFQDPASAEKVIESQQSTATWREILESHVARDPDWEIDRTLPAIIPFLKTATPNEAYAKIRVPQMSSGATSA